MGSRHRWAPRRGRSGARWSCPSFGARQPRAFVYAFAISLGEFGATSFLTRPDIPTLPIAVYRYLSLPGALNFGQAMAMAVILLAVCAVSMLLVDRLQLPSAVKMLNEEKQNNA